MKNLMLRKLLPGVLALTAVFAVVALVSNWLLPSAEEAYFSVTPEEWGKLSEVEAAERVGFLEEADGYASAIGELVYGQAWPEVFRGRNGSDKVEVTFAEGISHGVLENGADAPGEVRLNQMLFEHELAPIAHEVAHVVRVCGNLSLAEGFASYCQDRFGENPALFGFGENAHSLAKLYNGVEYDAVRGSIGAIGQSTAGKGDNRTAFYTLSNSFVTYLIDSYGMDSFRQLYLTNGAAVNYIMAYGKELGELQEEWMAFLENYPGEPRETLLERMEQTLLEHGIGSEIAEVMLRELYGEKAA